MSNNVLHVENVTMQFGGVVAVNNLSLDIPEGKIVALIGPNGAGKTTAFNCITGVYQPTNGKVSFEGKLIVSNHPTGKMKKNYQGYNADKFVHEPIVDPTPDKILSHPSLLNMWMVSFCVLNKFFTPRQLYGRVFSQTEITPSF